MQKNTRKLILVTTISILGFFLDRFSKYLVAQNMELGETIPLLKGIFHITYIINEGIVFGLFHDNSLVFISVSIIGLIFISNFFIKIFKDIASHSTIKLISYGLIIGGGLGNTYDRFFLGYVIDFLDFLKFWRFIFNPADLFIHIGFILYVVDKYLEKRKYL
jgi:signal peptidase II